MNNARRARPITGQVNVRKSPAVTPGLGRPKPDRVRRAHPVIGTGQHGEFVKRCPNSRETRTDQANGWSSLTVNPALGRPILDRVRMAQPVIGSGQRVEVTIVTTQTLGDAGRLSRGNPAWISEQISTNKLSKGCIIIGRP